MSDGTARWAASAAVALFVVVGALRSSQGLAVITVSVSVAILAGWFMQSTYLRPGGWRLVGVAAIAATAVSVLCSGADSSSNIGWFALCVLAGWCSIRGGAALGIAFAGLAIAVFAGEWIATDADPGWAAWMAGTVFTTVVFLMARRQQELIEQLRIAQTGLAARARADERNRIARELHDVIAHSLTVSLLHVTSARLAVEEDPAEAAAALAEAERLGRQSLTEVRAAVGLLRDGGNSPAAPLPGAGQLPALIESFRRAGVQVAYQVLGDPSRLNATVGLTVYRILQEALTNAARHAAGTDISVRLEVTDERTVLTIHSDGAPAGASGGAGLDSMRERALALGGTVSIGPSGGGWRVQAVLPGRAVPAAAELG
jgi:signal transduction histidine kinase